MTKVALLTPGLLNGHDAITIELVETGTHPAVVIITWPSKPTVIHPQPSPTPLLRPRSCSLRPPQN